MATRQKRVVQRANPIHVSSMSDDAPEAVTPVKSQKKSKSKKVSTNVTNETCHLALSFFPDHYSPHNLVSPRFIILDCFR